MFFVGILLRNPSKVSSVKMLKNIELEEDIYFLKTNLVSSLPFGFKQPLKAFAVDQCGQGKQLQIRLLRLRKT